MQYRLLAVDDQRVAGVVTALEAHHGGGTFRQEINDLTFALVTPLRADDNDISTAHGFTALLNRA